MLTSSASQPCPPGPGGAAAAPGARDRWLLMRLLGAARSAPRVADRLIAERGTLGSVLATSDERLRQLGADANGIAILSLLREAIQAVLEPSEETRPLIRDAGQIAHALRGEMAWLPTEQVRAAYLDAGRRLIRLEVVGKGSVRSAAIYPRELARRCLELSAAGLILVHNHPSGDPEPSAEDRSMSLRVAAALETIEVQLIDHLVIARGGWASALPRPANDAHLSTARISTVRPCEKVADKA